MNRIKPNSNRIKPNSNRNQTENKRKSNRNQTEIKPNQIDLKEGVRGAARDERPSLRAPPAETPRGEARGAPRAVADAARGGVRYAPPSTLSLHTATRPGKVGSYLHEAGWGSIVTSLSQAGQLYNPCSVNPYPSPLNVGGDTRGGSTSSKRFTRAVHHPKVPGWRGNGAPRKTAKFLCYDGIVLLL